MTNQWLKGRVFSVLLILSLSMAACIQPAAMSPSAMNSNQHLAKLTGSWQVETTVVKQAAIFPSLFTFTSDGIVIADEPPSPFETSGHGNWVATGPDTAEFTFLALIGSAEGPLAATIKVVSSLQYDGSADTWEGPFTVQVVDAKGTEIFADSGTFKAARITIESLSNESTAVFNAFNAAVNAHNVDKALSFFADDATAQLPPPDNTLYKGKTEIRTWLENDAKNNIHVEIENAKVSGDTVSATAKVDVDNLPPDLILVGTVEVTVKNGKITAFSYTLSEKTLTELMSAAENKPILAVFDLATDSAEQYDQIIQALEAAGADSPQGRLYHVAYAKDGGIVVVDIWESGALLDQFAQTLIPVLQELGVTPTVPQIYPVHDIITAAESADLASTAESKPIFIVVDLAFESSEQYDRLTKDLEAAGAGSSQGRLYHIAYAKDGGIVVADVWESGELLDQFAQTLVPVLQKGGVTPIQPQIYPVYNIISSSTR